MAEKKAFALRLDPALHGAIERLAARNFRSVTPELEVLRGEASQRRGAKLPVPDPPRRGRPPKDAKP